MSGQFACSSSRASLSVVVAGFQEQQGLLPLLDGDLGGAGDVVGDPFLTRHARMRRQLLGGPLADPLGGRLVGGRLVWWVVIGRVSRVGITPFPGPVAGRVVALVTGWW